MELTKKMGLQEMDYNEALNTFKNKNGFDGSEDAKLEHLLRLEVFYCENKSNLLDWLPTFANAAWQCYDITMSYEGYSTRKNNMDEQELAEIFFRSSRIITEDEFREILDYVMSQDDNITLFSVVHKTMMTDDLDEMYEDIYQHWSIDSYQSLYDFTDEEMKDIFGEDWKIFS
jgi:hypothetical protein